MDLEITFPASSSSDANLLASELRSTLLSHGISKDVVRLTRTNVEHMDVGGALEIARLGVEAILAMHATFNLGQLIHEFSKRSHCTIRIRSSVANVDVTTKAGDQADFAETLQKLAEVYRAHPSR